jgi:hypothetical protein
MVQAYEAGITARGRDSDSRRFAASGVENGPILIGRAGETAWNAAPERESVFVRIWSVVRAALRLIVPVFLLLGILGASYMYGDIKIPAISLAPWLSLGHALLIVPFFVVMLTNRRYGPSYALAQVVIAMGIVGSVTVANASELTTLMPQVAQISERVAIAFTCAFFAANFAGIIAFDAARGPRWWSAPLVAAIVSAVMFTGIYYTAAFLGSNEVDWVSHMGLHAAVLAGAGIAMLLPYWMLRRVVPPLPGYNGY